MCNRKFGFFYIFCIFIFYKFLFSQYLSIISPFQCLKKFLLFFMQNIHKKKWKVQRGLRRLRMAVPLCCHKPLSSRLQIRGKDVSFSSIFSYNNK